jgi:hypothetical protein
VTPIDILLTTYNRNALLVKTLERLFTCTRSPYRLHVVDDGSEEENPPLLWEMYKEGQLASLTLRGERAGVRANQNLAAGLTFSDPIVLADDDVWVPNLEPDWLTQGLRALEKRPRLAMLALRHPGAKHKLRRTDGPVWYCQSVGATFCLVRRAFLLAHPLPHQRGDRGRPMEWRCKKALAEGWQIGVLANVWCYHAGKESVLTGQAYPGRTIAPTDWQTLVPPEEWWER